MTTARLATRGLGTPLQSGYSIALQYILQCRESRPCREEPEDVNPLISSTSAQVVLHSAPSLVRQTNHLFCKTIPSPLVLESSSRRSWSSICQEEKKAMCFRAGMAYWTIPSHFQPHTLPQNAGVCRKPYFSSSALILPITRSNSQL